MPPVEHAVPGADLRRLIDAATHALAAAGVPSPGHDARELAAFVLGVPQLIPAMPPPVPADFAARYAAVVERRARREPLQLITGYAHFRHLRLRVQPGVFIPRPETEVVTEHAIEAARAVQQRGRDPLVVDLCCGAGPIALSVAREVPGAVVLAVDANPAAVELTRRNARELGLQVRAIHADVRAADLLEEHRGRVDVVAANPPYIPPGAQPRQQEVRDHDPHLALYGGGPDGLDVPRAVIGAAARLLRPGGLLVMEHAEVQDERVRAAVVEADAFTGVRTARDLADRPRMVLARRRG